MAEIDLGQEEIRELAASVIEAAGNPPEPFGVYFFEPEAPESELARYTERVVFRKWFGNPAELLEAEYRPYEKNAFFLSVLDHHRKLPAGMGRVGLPSDRRRKSFDDLERIWGVDVDDLELTATKSWSIEETWDSLTIGVDDEYRGKSTDGLISLAMLQTGARSMRRVGARTTVTIMDLNVLEMLQTMMHEPYQRFIGVEPMSYLDSPLSLPVVLDIDEWEPRLAATDPVMHELMFHGVGIEAAVRPPDWPAFLPAADRSGVRR